ncbi:uncharacterized protein LOC113769034 [Coffea eugenioides]|uniref:uncharacterized protein LOC113769034 n=1 Tax=Coffea eugenioides TaxID=49369 RepID=UPI000F615C8F|nr:uncharacterized protein LOC113769034 [Coffea eugenioides]
MGRPRKYVSLKEATRERNARRRRQRANANAHANSREYRDTAARTRLSVPIKQPSSGPSSVELRCKSLVNIDTEGVSGRDGHHVGSICSRSNGSSISHARNKRTRQDCAETSVGRMHEYVEEMRIESTALPSTSNSSITGYSRDTCSEPIIAGGSTLSTPANKKCRSVRPGDARQERRKMLATDPLNVVATEPDILPDIPDCQHCKAKKFQFEPPGFCCSSGEIQLLPTEMPRELMMLYLEDSEEAIEFRRCVRSYNNMFAFTSIGVNCDKSLNESYNGIYTFRIQGQMYHFINQLIPDDGEKARNVQLYFFDTEHETVNRLSISNRFQRSLITKLEGILKINPYFAFFRGLHNLPNIDNYKIVLQSSPAVDQKVFNKPTVSQVGAVWTDNCDNGHVTSQHIQVYGKNGKTQIMKHYFSCYDPLQYPLIFASVEPGWHQGINRIARTPNVHGATSCEREVELAPGAGTTPDQLMNAENLDFYRLNDNQTRLRTKLYQSLIDSLSQGESSSSNIGTRIILPGSFIGGPRDMRRRYMDAMSLVQ